MSARIVLGTVMGVALAGLAVPALAHPHVWITARAEVVYGPDGKITGVRHAWTFDKGYSAFITQGLDSNKDGKIAPEEMKDLAKENTESLVEFEYFTSLKTSGAKQAFAAPRDYAMAFENGEVTLSYLLPLKAPANGTKAVVLEITDPTYFVSFTLADGKDAVKLAGAPKGCTAAITRPKPMEVAEQQKLSESFFEALTAASNFGAQFANRAIIACP
jgi:ABC-type uncharacterized transport system substrate-binding protein